MRSVAVITDRSLSARVLPTRAGGIMPAQVMSFLRWAASTGRAVARRGEERRTIAHLRGLTDAQLRDIGIDRPDILRLVRGRPTGTA